MCIRDRALDDPSAWKPLPCGPEVHLATQVPLQFTILPSGVDVVAEEVRLEREIRLHLIDARGAQGISATRWDDDLGYLLMPALAAYESADYAAAGHRCKCHLHSGIIKGDENAMGSI